VCMCACVCMSAWAHARTLCVYGYVRAIVCSGKRCARCRARCGIRYTGRARVRPPSTPNSGFELGAELNI